MLLYVLHSEMNTTLLLLVGEDQQYKEKCELENVFQVAVYAVHEGDLLMAEEVT